MRLLAISDLHVGHRINRDALDRLRPGADDWLILAGDLGETAEHLDRVFDALQPRCGKLLWVPGNHELWSSERSPARGEDRYLGWVQRCRARGVLTPEDPWARWEGPGGPATVALLFLLYDYTFRPEGLDAQAALAQAARAGIVCADEWYLHPDPYPTRAAWCAARVDAARARLDALAPTERTVLVNHWPLRQDLARLPRIPEFALWCGTRATEDWHVRYRAKAVIAGHLHLRTTDWRDGTRFEEVSLGYPRHWRKDADPQRYLREVLPGPDGPPAGRGGPVVHR